MNIKADTLDRVTNSTLELPSVCVISVLENNFKEILSYIETESACTDVAAKCVLHFN